MAVLSHRKKGMVGDGAGRLEDAVAAAGVLEDTEANLSRERFDGRIGHRSVVCHPYGKGVSTGRMIGRSYRPHCRQQLVYAQSEHLSKPKVKLVDNADQLCNTEYV